MGIEKIDKAFKIGKTIVDGGLKRYILPNDNFDLYGVYYDIYKNKFYRMDSSIADVISDGVKLLATYTSGGRIRFSTNSSKFEISVKYDSLCNMSHMALEGSSGFMLVEENQDGSNGFYKMFAPSADQKDGFAYSIDLPSDKMRSYILWFPLYNEISELIISFDEKAKVEKGRSYRKEMPILYYGSSITQGGCASRPDNSYPALISKWNNIDFINLGFSGWGLAEDSMVDYLATIKCSLFVCDYDHNAPDLNYLQKTHYRLYSRYREKNPNVPILFLTAPNDCFEKHGDRYKTIKQTYIKAKKLGDKNVHFIDGWSLLGKKDRMNCLVDGCHPTDLGFYRMASKIYNKMVSIDKKFK